MTDKQLFAKYLEKMESFNDERYSLMADDFSYGKTSYLQMKFRGSSVFNPVWITEIEDCLYALDQITNNPKEATTQYGAITPIELAKKINSESVQHLASHSQYIKEIDKEGNVIPAKILSQFSKEELHTYENRFIATFIRRLILFIDKRYEFVKDTVMLDEKDVLYVKNVSRVDGKEVEIETKVTVRTECEDETTIAAKEYIERLKKAKEYVGYYYSSPFMKELKTEKDVRRPIVLTNILRKNPLYHKCYETFLFIERFDSLGVAFSVDRSYQYFDAKRQRAMTHILLSNLLFLESDTSKPYKKTNKQYKPKLLPSIDDEIFIYDDLVKGPVEYVRCDDNYVNYLRGLSPTDIPVHPIKGERRFYKEKYLRKKNVADGVDSIESLLARTRKKIATYEKKVEKLINARKIAEAKQLQKELKELREYEQDVLNKIRARIIEEGESDLVKNAKKEGAAKRKAEAAKEAKAAKEEKPAETPKTEENPAKAPIVTEKPVENADVTPKAEEKPVQNAGETPQVEEKTAQNPDENPVVEKKPLQNADENKETAKPNGEGESK